MDDNKSAVDTAQYETYPEFKEEILKLMAAKEFTSVIELALAHQSKFLSLAHIILANAFINRATANPNNVVKADAIISFTHIQLAIKYAPDSVDLFLANDVKNPEDRFCDRVAKEFIQVNSDQFNIELTEADNKAIETAAEEFYKTHPVTQNNGCGW